MIDSINGFQVFIVEYLTSDGYRSTLPLPKQDAFEYCFQTFFPIYTGLDQLPPKHKRVWKIIQHVLEEDFFRFTQELWTPVALARLPEYAQIEYQKYLKKLTSIDFSK